MSETVLIVDDEKDFLDIMTERMRARGIRVLATTSVEDALKMVEEYACDVVIMDFMMPGIDGFKALKLLKAQRPGIQIILLSGNVSGLLAVRAKTLGVLEIFEKPVDIEVLMRKIKNAGS